MSGTTTSVIRPQKIPLCSSVLSSGGGMRGVVGHTDSDSSKNDGPWLHLFGIDSSERTLPQVRSSVGLLLESTYRQVHSAELLNFGYPGANKHLESVGFRFEPG